MALGKYHETFLQRDLPGEAQLDRLVNTGDIGQCWLRMVGRRVRAKGQGVSRELPRGEILAGEIEWRWGSTDRVNVGGWVEWLN